MVKEIFYVEVMTKYGAKIGSKQFIDFPSKHQVAVVIKELGGYQAKIDKRYELMYD